jgi:hypothetical protein
VLGFAACQPAPLSPSEGSAPAAPRASEPPASPQAPSPEGRLFGAPLELSEAVDVSVILAGPEPYLGKRVQCSGVVGRVCERAGCWLELRPEGSQGPGLRVPMAGHRFFIPQDAVGRPARVEGQLVARALGAAERAHLEGEGLKAIGPLSLAATGVLLLAPGSAPAGVVR